MCLVMHLIAMGSAICQLIPYGIRWNIRLISFKIPITSVSMPVILFMRRDTISSNSWVFITRFQMVHPNL